MCQGKTDADPTKDPEPGLAKYFALDSTQAIQDELARNRALACKEGLVARGVPEPQLVITWKGCGGASKVSFTPLVPISRLHLAYISPASRGGGAPCSRARSHAPRASSLRPRAPPPPEI